MGKRSLRLMPENPFLLVMIADIAAKQGDLDLAVDERARRAPIPGARRSAVSDFAAAVAAAARPAARNRALRQGRVAAVREQYKEAEQSLLASLTLNPDDMEALYTIGVVRMAVRADEGAARAFARVAQDRCRDGHAARESLRVLHARSAAAQA